MIIYVTISLGHTAAWIVSTQICPWKKNGIRLKSRWQASVLERSPICSPDFANCVDAFNYQVQWPNLTERRWKGSVYGAICWSLLFYAWRCSLGTRTTLQFSPYTNFCRVYRYEWTPFLCVFLGPESCPQLKLDGDWICSVALTSLSPWASSCLLCLQYLARICHSVSALHKGLYPERGALPSSTVGHTWSTNFFLLHGSHMLTFSL